MRIETLPSPGRLASGISLRSVAANAISAVEINAAIPGGGGKSSHAKRLSDFFTACAAAVSGFIDAVVPTVLTRTITVDRPDRVRIKLGKGIDGQYVPAPAAFALTTPTKVISKVAFDGPYVDLYVTVPYTAADTVVKVAYTVPGADQIRDLSGNQLASFTAAVVVNSAA